MHALSNPGKSRRVLISLLVLTFLLISAALFTYLAVPTHPAQADDRVDVLIVLGAPALPNGKPSAEQFARVLQAVHEFKLQRSTHLLLAGGSAGNRFVESDVMADIAERAGVPASAITRERLSSNTRENIANSVQIMRSEGWKSAEIVSAKSHLPRAALILSRYPVTWTTDGAPWPTSYERKTIMHQYLREVLGTAWMRLFGFRFHPPSSARQIR